MRNRLGPVLLFLCGSAFVAAGAPVEDPQFEVFRRAASLGLEPLLTGLFADPDMLRRLDGLDEPDAIRLDLDGDGSIDALAWREGSVRVAAIAPGLDDDASARRPRGGEVCYVADGNADGAPERVVEYFDRDGDGRADRQDIYELGPGALGTSGVGVTIFIDHDGTNDLLHTTGYAYHSNRDIWLSDFDGNLCLVAGWRDEETGKWRSAFENPFCFYDHDGDGRSDEALRLEGEDLRFTSVRWSFDADGDAGEARGYDYDFSLTAIGGVSAPESLADSVLLRDGGVMRFVAWERARDLARWGIWRSALLVWDEEDRNVDPTGPDRERWEGVIAEPFFGFPQVGGPACGRINKRYELDLDGSGRLGLYRSGVDNRIHLSGAERGEILIQLRGDPSVDRIVRMADSSGNGYFDTWSYSISESRTREVRLRDEKVRGVPLDAQAIRTLWSRELPRSRDEAARDARQLESSIRWKEPNEVGRYLSAARDRNDPWIVRASRSVETDRYLKEIALWELGGGFLSLGPGPGEPAAAVTIEREHTGGSWEIPLSSLTSEIARAIAPGSFVEGSIDGQRIPGQVEDLDGDGSVDRLYLAPTQGSTIRLEIDPPSPLAPLDGVRVDPYFPGGIAFESMPVAWRTYQARLDLFLKRRPRLILRGRLGDHHAPQEWGMDALDIGDGPGVGGLYIRAGDHWIACFGPDRFDGHRVVAEGPHRVSIEVLLDAGGERLRRNWSLESGATVMIEEVATLSGAGCDLASALPAADTWDLYEGEKALWTFGPSAERAGAVGLAGRFLSGEGVRIETIEGHPALVYRIAPERPARIAWTAGGEIAGDSTAVDWRNRAWDRLRDIVSQADR